MTPTTTVRAPRQPSGELRSIVRFDAYTGGSDVYWRDYRAALSAYDRDWHSDVAELGSSGKDEGDE